MDLLAVSCLNELINRSMNQPTKIRADGAVKFCRVHDVVLDFIVSQAVEDNFVVVKNGEGFSVNSSNKMRRLSIQTDFSGAEEMANALKQNVYLIFDRFISSVILTKWVITSQVFLTATSCVC
jgi:hypothetical protein